MALNLTTREATLHTLRGNMPRQEVKPKALPEPVKSEPAAPVSPAPTVQIDMQPVADALRQGQALMAHALAAREPAEPAAPAPTQWQFKITERDRMGNIISFTASPAVASTAASTSS